MDADDEKLITGRSIRSFAKGSRASRRLSRRLSTLAHDSVSAHIGETYSFGTATVIGLNMTLGTGPLMLPFAFAQAGLLLGGAFLGFCAFIAYVTATYVIEVLVLENADLFEHCESDLMAKLLEQEVIDAQGGHPDDMTTKPTCKGDTQQKASHYISESRLNRPDKVFKIRERIEMGEMGSRLMSQLWYDLLYLFLFLHTFGTLCVYAVALTSSVQSLLPGGAELHGPIVAGLAVVLFPLCFANMQKLRQLQWAIMTVRAVAIVTMIAGAVYLALTRPSVHEEEAAAAAAGSGGVWMWGRVPLADPSGLQSLFANAVLAFMVHHSLPGFLAPLDDQDAAPKAVAVSYAFSYVTYLVLGVSALVAFGRDVPQLYNLAFGGLPRVVNVFLCGYPLMLLAVYPIVGISFRNNFLGALGLPPPDPQGPVAPKDIAATAVASLPPLAVAYATSNVQGIVKIFAGYFGLSLMLFMPTLLVWTARRHILAAGQEFSLKSRWASTPMMVLVLTSWLGAILFNTYRFFFA